MKGRKSHPCFWLWIGLGLLLVLPYAVAWMEQNERWVFTGFLFAVEDGNSYIAKMLLGRTGAWRFTTPYTVEPQGKYWLFGPYLLLGKLAWGPDLHAQLVLLFHLFRLVAAAWLAWSTWRFLGWFVQGQARWLAWALSLFGGGLGWVPWFLGQNTLPLSWYSPEGFGFLMLYGLPHLALARALMLSILIKLLEAFPDLSPSTSKAPSTLPSLFLSTLALGWIHGFALTTSVLLVGGMGLWWLRQKHVMKTSSGVLSRVGVVLLAAIPWLLYLAYLARFDAFARIWTQQNILPTPPWTTLAWAYAWVLPWAIPGWLRLRRERPTLAFLAAWWVGAALTLSHLPFSVQRRFLEGIWVVLSALVGVGLERRAQESTSLRLLPRSMAQGLWFPLLLSLPSVLLFWTATWQAALIPQPPIYRPRDEVAAFQALATLAQPGDPVMAAYPTGNALPAWAPVRVPLGLGPESIRFPVWENRVRSFYQAQTPDAWRRNLLSTWGFRFVFYGPQERALGTWNPQEAPYLHLRYQRGAYAVYEVVMP